MPTVSDDTNITTSVTVNDNTSVTVNDNTGATGDSAADATTSITAVASAVFTTAVFVDVTSTEPTVYELEEKLNKILQDLNISSESNLLFVGHI